MARKHPAMYPGSSIREGKHDTRSLEEILASITRKFPICQQERINTLDSPLVIENACPGWQPRHWAPRWAYIGKLPVGYEEGGLRYPAVPVTIEEQVDTLVEAAKGGCALLHTHPRDPKDGAAMHDPELETEILQRVFDQVDVVTCQHTWKAAPNGPIDYITDTKKYLERGGGNRYVQSVVCLWPPADSYPPSFEASVQEGVEWLQEHKITPVHKIRGSFHLRKLKRLLLDSEISSHVQKHVLVHDMGHPNGWTMDIDPWWPIDMITSLETSKERIPNSVIGVYSGGRNWMRITMMAILAGVDLVRVGIEDCYWMYAHRDDVIQRNIDAVNKITDFCKLIGRRIASPTEARQILGVERTS